ncbi:hypothetical protein FQR65_LT10538 [Abscondita terminalis]|nr:hypothetical protein FQR65_LT10538 [Abscondita terminalis]
MQLAKCVPVINNFDIWNDRNNSEANLFDDVNLERLPRVLNFFPVPFEEECLSTDRRRKGVCMNAYECNFQSGTSRGKCALGFGGQPNRRTGVCDDDIFVVSGGVSKDLKLCGLNSGQHAYFDVENVNDTITIAMSMGNKILSRLWEVRVTQIPFTDRAPAGCLQYHTGNKGIIQTMNFAENGRHLADQEYNICMRQEMGMCSIAYEPCHENSFKLVSSLPDTVDDTSSVINGENDIGSGDGIARMDTMCDDRIYLPCDTDDLITPGGGSLGLCNLGQCGDSFCPAGEKTCRIESSVTPFMIGIQFGPGVREESPEDNLGMCLKYEQLSCA